MLSLTTAQRDLLQILLSSDRPIGATALGQQLHLTPRQVHYSLRDIKAWLLRRHVSLRHLPGVGVQVLCSPEQRQRLLVELASRAKFQLVLTPDQRQQLVALALLSADEPYTLGQLQEELAVARATVLKDLDLIEPWLGSFGLQIARRQHRGCWVAGAELARRQALAALLWGDVPFERPILAVRPSEGIVFALAQDAALLPIVARANAFVGACDLATGQRQIEQAEAELAARFTDDAVLPLALAGAIQLQRARAGQHAVWDAATLSWVQAQVTWPVAVRVGSRLWPGLSAEARAAETAAFAVQLLCGARDEPWRGEQATNELIDTLARHTAAAYGVPELAHDGLLRDGLEVLVLPACARQRFGVWAPPTSTADAYTERYARERAVADTLAADVAAATGSPLPPDARDDLVLLLRAAVVRARPERARHVLVICPSGMATTQLLVARLRSRFPRLGTFEVLPMRELTAERIAGADLIITTVPLAPRDAPPIDIIHVHPMLRPEDIAALTQWMV